MRFSIPKAAAIAAFSLIILPHISMAQEAAPASNAPPPGVEIKAAPADTVNMAPESGAYPLLRLTPDKSEIVRLNADAATVIVGNPNHLSVLAENTKTLVLVPKAEGATYFTVMDKNSGIIMQRHVVISTGTDKYIRIRRACSGNANCQPTQVYYCPDMCHEIITDQGSNTAGSGTSSAPIMPSNANSSQEALEAVEKLNQDANAQTSGVGISVAPNGSAVPVAPVVTEEGR
jgi:hypothetical protein